MCSRPSGSPSALAAQGIAVLRFDFTGLGSSEGDFANTTFSSNVADLVRAADHLRETHGAPAILIGHSLGGAAVLAAAHEMPEAQAVVTIAAPADPAHVTGLFKDRIEDIRSTARSRCQLAGRPFHITQRLPRRRRRARPDGACRQAAQGAAGACIRRPTTPSASTMPPRIFVAARHPKSFVSLAGADHLLSNRRDSTYVADVIAAWAERYLDRSPEPAATPTTRRAVVVRETRNGKFQQAVRSGRIA